MKQALIFAFAVVPAVAAADCNSESVIFRSALESRGYLVEAFSEVAEIDGTCGVQGIAFAEENLAVEIADLSWQLKGLEALTSGTGVLSFEATLTDLRMSPRTPDRWVSYMLSEQNRRNTIDATFNLTWDLLREHFDCPFIWGGPGPTLEPQKCIDYADILCINEGEEVIVELAGCLDAGTDYSTIMGTWCKRGDEVIKNENRPLMKLDDLAQPDWGVERYVYVNGDTVEREYYPENNSRTYSIMTQRGCPFSCHFC